MKENKTLITKATNKPAINIINKYTKIKTNHKPI